MDTDVAALTALAKTYFKRPSTNSAIYSFAVDSDNMIKSFQGSRMYA
jgi:hypothetical protein